MSEPAPNPSRSAEPIAIIGIGCRLPGGADSPEALWELLSAGRDAVVDVPADRWELRRFFDGDSDLAGKTHARQGGFLREKIDAFDAAFFGFSPREAESLDPQQRLLLETAWEALERAGQDVGRLRGSATGVFVGGFCMDNQLLRLLPANRHLIDAFSATGFSLTLLSNRLSHFFDFRGPSMSLDTACSSSLAAVHLACTSLWRGESSLALAGGVNVMLRPEYAIAMSKGGFLSPQARCMTFDERAAGYARGEGAAVLVLKPWSAAVADGDLVYALIRATGVNQDGRTPGITQPNATSQQALMRRVCAEAGVAPGELAYVEAHGTGTQIGDFVEATALDAVLREGRRAETPCWVGSVKTNLGHLEAAAGVTGLIKAALVLRHRQVPPNLHFQRPNPKLDFAQMCLRVPTRLEPLPEPANGRLLAAVNSFGYGGTNAHVVIEAAPLAGADEARTDESFGRPGLFPWSTRSAAALRQLAGGIAQRMRAPGAGVLEDWIHTAARRRTHLEERAVALVSDGESLRTSLERFTAGERVPEIVTSEAQPETRGCVFVFTGMGPQWWGMGRELRATEPVFREAFDRVAAEFGRLAGWDLGAAMGEDEATSRIGEAAVAQPANFALQVALATLWRHWGILPDAIIGHSAGEVAAAYVAGALTLEEATRVCYQRSRLQQRLSGKGAMLAVGLPAAEVEPWVKGEAGACIAAVNAPSGVTLAGERAALERIAARLPAGVFQRFLKVDVPYHSPLMEEIVPELMESLNGLRAAAPTVPFYSTVTGCAVASDERLFDADYWRRNVVEPVRFAEACRALIADGFTRFLEIGPHPALADSVQQNLAAVGVRGTTLASLERKTSECERMRRTLAQLYVIGHEIDWRALAPAAGRFVAFPPYPWQRQRHWLESAASRSDRVGNGRHPFVDQPVAAPRPTWEIEVNAAYFPYLNDHRIGEAVVFPGAGYLEAALVVHREQYGSVACVVEQLSFERMLVHDAKRPAVLRVEFDPEARALSLYSRPAPESERWTRHAKGFLRHVIDPSPVPGIALPSPGAGEVKAPLELYRALERRGLRYGPWFRTLRGLRRVGDEAFLQLRGHPQIAGLRQDIAHPTLVDGALQGLVALLETEDGGTTFVPAGIARVVCHDTVPREGWARLRLTTVTPTRAVAEAVICDHRGAVKLELGGIELRAVGSKATAREEETFYVPHWRETTLANEAVAGVCVIEGGGELLRRRLSERLVAAGWRVVATAEELPSGGRLIFIGEAVTRPVTVEGVLEESMRLVRRLQELPAEVKRCVVLACPSSQIVTGREKDISLAHLTWAGIAAVSGNESPNVTCRVVDIDFSDTEAAAEVLAREAAADEDEREVAWREGRRFVRELRRARGAFATAPEISARGAYLVTGGTRGFGLEVARWLVRHEAGRVVLASRAGAATPGLAEALVELESGRTKVDVVTVDVSDEAAVRGLVRELAGQALPLRGVFHGAMVLDDAMLRDQTAERFARVFGPKLGGALHLHRCTQELELDHFVCFSSISAVIGNPGQSNYAAANAFLDGLAHYRRRHGLPGLAIDLGLLAETGVAAQREDLQRVLDTVGVTPLTTAEALAGMAAGLAQGGPQLGVFRVDWQRWAQAFPAAARDRRFARVLDRPDVGGAPVEGDAVRRRLRALPAEERQAVLVQTLRTYLAASLRVPEASLTEKDELGRLGADSLAMVELIATVNREFGVQLSPVDLLRNPSLAGLAGAVLGRLELAG
jgi:Polyketide synthase modules and related proteins